MPSLSVDEGPTPPSDRLSPQIRTGVAAQGKKDASWTTGVDQRVYCLAAKRSKFPNPIGKIGSFTEIRFAIILGLNGGAQNYVAQDRRHRIMIWVGSEILPHEADLRRWLRRSMGVDDLEDVIQEAYCRLSALDDVSHIASGRGYLFATARNIALERIRRSRIVSMESVTEIDALSIYVEQSSPEQIIASRHELARVGRLIEQLPERCRQVFEMRKIQGLSQREVADALGIKEDTVENDVRRGLKLMLKAIADSDANINTELNETERNGRTRNAARDR